MPPHSRGHFLVALAARSGYLAAMKVFRLIPFLLAMAAAALPAGAQKFIPKKITFEGVTASQAELLAASGLTPGNAIAQPDLQAAAQKLLDTGMFSDIRFAYDGVELKYMLKAADNMEPAMYADFPWWDAASLNTAVATRVPLFHGSLAPESGMQQLVADTLTKMLAEKGVQATVTAIPAQDPAGRGTGVEYHIDAPPVQIGAVSFAGVVAPWNEPVGAIAKAAAGQNYDGATEATLMTALRAIYHRQGYLEMAMSGFAHGAPQVSDGKVLVPVSATIDEGPQYKVASMTVAGGVLMSPEDFAKAAKLHPGDVANEDLLRGTLAMVAQPYKSHGYLRAKIEATPKFDPEQHTVSYAITVQPGPVFRMGELSLVNLSDAQKADVLKYWPLREGDVYDATLAVSFLLKNKNNLHSLDGWSGSWKAYEHEDTQVVDLVVTFRQGGTLQ